MSTRSSPNCGCRCSPTPAFFHRLELTGAARYSDYSTSGSTTTFKAGLNWEPIEDLLFRGSWAEGFRAPSIGELFGTPSRFDQEVVDPCSGMTAPRLPATSRTNCVAQGVPANGSYIQLNAQLPVITGGNDDLKPETSESWVFGAVWRPSFLPRLSLEANYYNIKVDGAIQAIDAGTLLGRCAITHDALSCASITRTASGQIAQIRASCRTSPASRPTGSTSPSTTAPPRPGGDVRPLLGQHLPVQLRRSVPATVGVTEIEREGTEQGSPDQAFPEFKSTASSTGRRTTSAPR